MQHNPDRDEATPDHLSETPVALKFQELTAHLSSVADRHFPGIRKPKQKSEIINKVREQMTQSLNDFFDDVYHDELDSFEEMCEANDFLAATAVRFVDDFIDEELWPKLPELVNELGKETLRGKYHEFLYEAFAIAKAYDSTLPADIIKLPQLELDFELNPDQSFFDENVEEYVKRKAFDLAYLDAKKGGNTEIDLDKCDTDDYMRKSASDVLRDFEYNYTPDTKDFDLFSLIKKYELNPQKLIDLIERYFPKIFINFEDWRNYDHRISFSNRSHEIGFYAYGERATRIIDHALNSIYAYKEKVEGLDYEDAA